MFELEDLDAYVQRGAALLDEKLPGWHERINLSALDLSSLLDCILGQLYGEYDRGLKELGPEGSTYGPNLFATSKGVEWAERHGFDAPVIYDANDWDLSGGYRPFNELEDLWREEISNRLPDADDSE